MPCQQNPERELPPRPIWIDEPPQADLQVWAKRFQAAFLTDWNRLVNWVLNRVPRETKLLCGGEVTYVSGLTYAVAYAEYLINGVFYSSPATTVTLAAQPATLNRIDEIILTTLSTAAALTGVPAANPVQPVPDPQTQLGIAAIFIPSVASGTPPGPPTPTPGGPINYTFARTFVLGFLGQDVVAGTNLTNEVWPWVTCSIVKVEAQSKSPGTGDILFDIKKNGTSVWASTSAWRISIPASDTAVHTSLVFDSTAIPCADKDKFSIDVVSISGSWRNVTVTVVFQARAD